MFHEACRPAQTLGFKCVIKAHEALLEELKQTAWAIGYRPEEMHRFRDDCSRGDEWARKGSPSLADEYVPLVTPVQNGDQRPCVDQD
jgi:hypothetical protein